MSTSRSLKNHLSVLEARHRELDKAINEEYDHYDSDEIVKKHKFQKLKLKQDIEQLRHEISIKEKEENEYK